MKDLKKSAKDKEFLRQMSYQQHSSELPANDRNRLQKGPHGQFTGNPLRPPSLRKLKLNLVELWVRLDGLEPRIVKASRVLTLRNAVRGPDSIRGLKL